MVDESFQTFCCFYKFIYQFKWEKQGHRSIVKEYLEAITMSKSYKKAKIKYYSDLKAT